MKRETKIFLEMIAMILLFNVEYRFKIIPDTCLIGSFIILFWWDMRRNIND
jgi:hypothetical protein